MKILIDNGHGENTPGKRSPDGTFREYAYTREIADEVVRELAKRGYVAERIVKENLDVPLAERARRVNEVCARYGANNVLLVSIHCNAAGNGEWMNARGWSAYTTKGKTKVSTNWQTECMMLPLALLLGKRLGVTIRMATRIGKKISTFFPKRNARLY